MKGESAYFELASTVLTMMHSGELTQELIGDGFRKLEDRAKDVKEAIGPERTQAIAAVRDAAREQYGSDELEIDQNCEISVTETGTWVQAWVWMERGDDEEGYEN